MGSGVVCQINNNLKCSLSNILSLKGLLLSFAVPETGPVVQWIE